MEKVRRFDFKIREHSYSYYYDDIDRLFLAIAQKYEDKGNPFSRGECKFIAEQLSWKNKHDIVQELVKGKNYEG